MSKGTLSIGIIGCGAVAEKGHLPALKKVAGVKINAFVDTNLTRAKLLRRYFKGAIVASDYRMILDEIVQITRNASLTVSRNFSFSEAKKQIYT